MTLIAVCRLHTSRMNLSEDVDLEEFVMAKDDMSGADIKAVCTEAGLLALRERRMRVTKADLTEAREKVCHLHFSRHSRSLTILHRCCTGRTKGRPRVCTCDICILHHTHTLLLVMSFVNLDRTWCAATVICVRSSEVVHSQMIGITHGELRLHDRWCSA